MSSQAKAPGAAREYDKCYQPPSCLASPTTPPPPEPKIPKSPEKQAEGSRPCSNDYKKMSYPDYDQCYQPPSCLASASSSPPPTQKPEIPNCSEQQAEVNGPYPEDYQRLSWSEVRGLINLHETPAPSLPPQQEIVIVSTNSLHGVDSVNDVRSWSSSPERRRKHFLDQMHKGRNISAENVGLCEFVF